MTRRTGMPAPTLRILGTRGVPAAHGGFETFAAQLALYLVARGWRVIVYCQRDGSGPPEEDVWQGVERVHFRCGRDTPRSTIVFDWKSILHAARTRDLCLTLGYNTAIFCAVLRARGAPNVINMDGIEWKRDKWSRVARLWFWLNEHAGARIGNHLVADHPEIARHLSRSVSLTKTTTIPYGADRLTGLSDAPVRALGLEPGRYLSLIARPEPENSVLEVVRGFSQRPRGVRLAVLGQYRDDNAFHRAVRAAASAEVDFLGPIYDRATVQALRLHSLAYVHGHRVGGTNPSLVEALGAGNAVLAHDNRFNRWVADAAALYFTDADGFAAVVDALLADLPGRQALQRAAVCRFEQAFRLDHVLLAYEKLLTAALPQFLR